MTKHNTSFADGWAGTVRPDDVEVTRAGLEVRFHHPDDAREKARRNTVGVPEWYWSRRVTPAFGVEAPRTWAGVQYPVIYLREGSAVDRRTGEPCWVAMKVVHQGGARVVVAVAPGEAARNGYLLVLTDRDYEPLRNVLFRRAGRRRPEPQARRPDGMTGNATNAK